MIRRAFDELELDYLVSGFALATAAFDFDAAEQWLEQIAALVEDREVGRAP